MDTSPRLVLFARGVIAILNTWPVLRIAVSESWGGPQSAQKRTWIASTLVDAFEASPLDEEEIEDLLLDAMVEEFETEIEDDSSRTVARDILNIWRDAGNGEMGNVLRLEAAANRLAHTQVHTTRREGNGDDEWVDEEGSDEGPSVEAAPQLLPATSSQAIEPIIDDDGFELVQRGSKRNGR